VRSLGSAPRAIVFLTVPDDAVEVMAERLAKSRPPIPASVSFAHVSGALDLGPLGPLRRRHAVGSFHPLQSFPQRRPPAAFHGITVAVDASTPVLKRRLDSLARALGAKPKEVGDGQRVLYHAAAVFASNYLDAVLAEAIRLLEAVGWSDQEAASALLPLAAGAIENLRKRGPVGALTGPVRRGDSETIKRHLAALEELDRSGAAGPGPKLAAVYRMLGAIALEIAKEAGLQPAAAELTQRALTPKRAATQGRRRV
jgi:predicted short-subunit dehydrogenase-like oxidoreductase (DUF2520 family)